MLSCCALTIPHISAANMVVNILFFIYFFPNDIIITPQVGIISSGYIIQPLHFINVGLLTYDPDNVANVQLLHGVGCEQSFLTF